MTPADERAFPIYLRVLDMVRAGRSLNEVASSVFGLRQPTRGDRKMVERYYARAEWMTSTGWQQLDNVGSVVRHGLFMSRVVANLGLDDWKEELPRLERFETFRVFVAAIASTAGADQDWRWSGGTPTAKQAKECDHENIAACQEECLRALATLPDHPLWPALSLLSCARLAACDLDNGKSQTTTSYHSFFFTAIKRALDAHDVAGIASLVGTLKNSPETDIVRAVAGEVRQFIVELLVDHPSDTIAMLLAPLDYRRP